MDAERVALEPHAAFPLEEGLETYVAENTRVRSKGFLHHEQELSALAEAAKEGRVPDGH